jgi:hypothetical protein
MALKNKQNGYRMHRKPASSIEKWKIEDALPAQALLVSGNQILKKCLVPIS